ncbi:hypothetical protein DFH06DRAFT_1478405 [Mycena polygramma]|nr:hypothetical protein DFH06DRAFT_1478405 [Mycena polygramma]
MSLPARSSAAADRARIAEIGARISELKSSIKLLKDEQNFYRKRLATYTYPVLTLPYEVVSKIFVQFLPVYPTPPPIRGILSPNVLGQICQKWRDIALTDPLLWRAISLSLRKDTGIPQKLQVLETWLKRSGSCPLSINLDIGKYSDSPETPNLFLQAITSHCARWEHLKLYSTSHHPFPSTTGPLPLLRTFYTCSIKDKTENSSPLISALHAAPLLRKVAVVWYDNYRPFFPWAQLTVVTVGGISAPNCVELLTKAVNLVYCQLNIPWFLGTEAPSLPAITLLNLETFILTGHPRGSPLAWRFVDTMTLPALRRFQVSQCILRKDPIATLVSLISRSGCLIHELCITEPSMADLPDLPSVGSVSFYPLDVTEAFIIELSLAKGADDEDAQPALENPEDAEPEDSSSDMDTDEQGDDGDD